MGNNVAIPELFGSNVFNDRTMRERLPKETYKASSRRSRRACRSIPRSRTSSPTP